MAPLSTSRVEHGLPDHIQRSRTGLGLPPYVPKTPPPPHQYFSHKSIPDLRARALATATQRSVSDMRSQAIERESSISSSRTSTTKKGEPSNASKGKATENVYVVAVSEHRVSGVQLESAAGEGRDTLRSGKRWREEDGADEMWQWRREEKHEADRQGEWDSGMLEFDRLRID
ncbi:hypothetical protein LTR37_018847 [Vermiconidia calcicola]|uniref:Uncharacterized protein n=1 Tax=Vermiconidia calcicola TaxID=1690605 RepID=A0ACC3MG53_9PEZI|nr:hypothetical protein LTR37_018847 [Vermiconidia calcicola]